MARKIKTEKTKKKSKKKVIVTVSVVVVIVLLAIVAWMLFFKNDGTKTIVEVKELDNLVEYQYVLTDRDTKYYKQEFEELKKILNEDVVDEEKYVTQVAKMFTIDLYTMTTKLNKYDVGGLEFYFDKQKNMYEQKVMDTLYATLLDDTYGDREQELPEVSGIEVVSTEKTSYVLGENEVDGYLVQLKISYVEDMGYDTEASLIVCKEEKIRWSVVDFQPTLNPEYE